jgi:hypothetical protein
MLHQLTYAEEVLPLQKRMQFTSRGDKKNITFDRIYIKKTTNIYDIKYIYID